MAKLYSSALLQNIVIIFINTIIQQLIASLTAYSGAPPRPYSKAGAILLFGRGIIQQSREVVERE